MGVCVRAWVCMRVCMCMCVCVCVCVHVHACVNVTCDPAKRRNIFLLTSIGVGFGNKSQYEGKVIELNYLQHKRMLHCTVLTSTNTTTTTTTTTTCTTTTTTAAAAAAAATTFSYGI